MEGGASGAASSSSATVSAGGAGGGPVGAGGGSSNQAKDANQRVVQEYFVLVEKSQQLFAGLRDLPQFGRHWQPYFQKTFEIYTKLWKYQQQYRAVLENAAVYGLKRWEIGEIASKIGQLYYHYYLRTSETNYIEESFIFYEAIRQRDYFRDVFDTKNALLVVKKLRYYARFIVVCLLLNRRSLVQLLVDELHALVEQYIRDFKPADAPAWKLVLQEISQFLQVDCPLEINDRPKDTPLSNRLKTPPSASAEGKMRLQEVILVGNYQNQVKFSELTLDMFRIMQALERERLANAPRTVEGESIDVSKPKKRSNPHKFLLHRPSFSQLLVFLATAFKELNDNNALLLYLSADGLLTTGDEPEKSGAGGRYDLGGISLSDTTVEAVPKHSTEASNSLYPEDILPFTRKKMFVIVESNNSTCFQALPNIFGKPVLFLMSPTAKDPAVEARGNVFTLFLYSPLTAFCMITGKTSIHQEVYDKCSKALDDSLDAIQKLLVTFDGIAPAFQHFGEEDFLQSFILRFIFCHAVLSLHTSSTAREANSRPSSHPALPSSFLSHPTVHAPVYSLAAIMGVTGQFVPQSTSQGEGSAASAS